MAIKNGTKLILDDLDAMLNMMNADSSDEENESENCGEEAVDNVLNELEETLATMSVEERVDYLRSLGFDVKMVSELPTSKDDKNNLISGEEPVNINL